MQPILDDEDKPVLYYGWVFDVRVVDEDHRLIAAARLYGDYRTYRDVLLAVFERYPRSRHVCKGYACLPVRYFDCDNELSYCLMRLGRRWPAGDDVTFMLRSADIKMSRRYRAGLD